MSRKIYLTLIPLIIILFISWTHISATSNKEQTDSLPSNNHSLALVDSITTEPTNGVETDCPTQYDPNSSFPQQAQTLPPAAGSYADPTFCNTVYRVSATSETPGGFETQEYSQLQPFSADNQYILLTGSEGYIVRRMNDFSQVNGLTAVWNTARWYTPQPHTIIHFDSNEDTTLRLQLTNVDTTSSSTIYTFPAQYERLITNRSSDELSDDGRWLAGVAQRNDGEWVIFAFDTINLALGTQLVITDLYGGTCSPDPEWGIIDPDWVGVSPLGNYLMVQWPVEGTNRCNGLESFDLQTGAFVGRPYDGFQHGDLGVDTDGTTEFFMTFESAGPPPDNNLPAIAMRLLPGTATSSDPIFLQSISWDVPDHISCQGPHGGCLVTAFGDDSNGWDPFEGEIFIQYTDGSVRRLAHHRSSECGYWVQPRASWSNDGRYAVFASDWGRELDCNDLGRGDPFVIDLGNVIIDYPYKHYIPVISNR